MNIKRILWDCDGTLFDSEALAMKVALDTVYNHLNSGYSPSLISDLAGYSFQMICDHAATQVGKKMNASDYRKLDEQQIVETIKILSQNVEPTYGTVESLDWLRTQQIDSSVVTSSPLSRVNPCLDRVLSDGLAVRRFFSLEQVFSAEDPTIFPEGPRSKPHPDIYLHALRYNNLKPEECVAIEDSTSGVRAAVRAGIPVIGYVGGRHIAEENRNKRTQELIDAARSPGENYKGVDYDIVVMERMNSLSKIIQAASQASRPEELPAIYAKMSHVVRTPLPSSNNASMVITDAGRQNSKNF